MCLEHEEAPDPDFPQFSRFPNELKLMVWEYAVSRKQILSLTPDQIPEKGDDYKYGRMPAFLCVDKMSRWVALAMNRYPIRFSFQYCNCSRQRPERWLKERCLLPPRNPGVQHCAMGPDDIVAIRVEHEYYTKWHERWTSSCLDGWSWDCKVQHSEFVGRWEGDYKLISNWMMLTPLNMFHLGGPYEHFQYSELPRYRDLDDLSHKEWCNTAEWLQEQFGDFFQPWGDEHGDYPTQLKNIYCLSFGWNQPKKTNLTAYDLVSVRKILYDLWNVDLMYWDRTWNEDGVVTESKEVASPEFVMVKGAKIVRWDSTKDLRLIKRRGAKRFIEKTLLSDRFSNWVPPKYRPWKRELKDDEDSSGWDTDDTEGGDSDESDDSD
jgi:hypothetical protein